MSARRSVTKAFESLREPFLKLDLKSSRLNKLFVEAIESKIQKLIWAKTLSGVFSEKWEAVIAVFHTAAVCYLQVMHSFSLINLWNVPYYVTVIYLLLSSFMVWAKNFWEQLCLYFQKVMNLPFNFVSWYNIAFFQSFYSKEFISCLILCQ